MSGDWANLIQNGPNPGERFAQAFQQGMQTREQNMARAAMAALVRDPNNQKALEALAGIDPGAAQQFQQQRQQQAMQGLERHRDNIIKGAQIVRQLQPKDQASWDQARATAAQAGIDMSEVPAQFDPQYVQGIVSIADSFAPQPQHNPQLVPFTQGGGVAAYDPATHGVNVLVQPNDGSHAPGAPMANVPHVTDQSSYDAVPAGGQYMTPDGHVRVKGGQAGQSSPATFR